MAKVTIHQESPSEGIVKAANAVAIVTDSNGRKIAVKKMGPSDRLRFLDLLGESAKNEQYLGYAALAYVATAIDGEPLPRPSTKAHLEVNSDRLGDEGLDAIAAHMAEQAQDKDGASLKNG